MNNCVFLKNRRAEIGETLTWTIATIIIVIILIVSIAISSSFGLTGFLKKSILARDSNLIPVKSLSAYLLTNDLEGSGKTIFEKLKEDETFEDLNGENGKLASQIFNVFYNQYYYEIWLGADKKGFNAKRKNDYFGSYAKTIEWESQGNRLCDSNIFYLTDKDKWVNLILCK